MERREQAVRQVTPIPAMAWTPPGSGWRFYFEASQGSQASANNSSRTMLRHRIHLSEGPTRSGQAQPVQAGAGVDLAPCSGGVTAVVSHEEETRLCQGPSGCGTCPYGLKAKIRYRAWYGADEDAVTRRLIRETCRCGGFVVFAITGEAHRQGDWSVEWIRA